MKQKQTIFSQDFYAQHLSTINNIHFTAREIDVIACLLNGRKTSKIAFFLSIDPRTVETHVRNIMSKLGCNSREGIIDFIEASDKASLLRKYYSLLRINVLFEKSLKDISKITREKKFHCFLMIGKDKTLLSLHLKSHLTLAGLIVSSAARNKEGDYVLCVLPKTLAGEEDSLFLQKAAQGQNKTLVLLQERRNYKEVPQELVQFDSIDFAKEDNYYFSFFLILKKLLEHPNLDKLTAEFKDKYKAIHPEPEMARITSNERKSENQFNYKINSKLALTLLLGIGILGGGFSALHWIQGNKNLSFRSDLVVPKNSACLYRPELIQKIDEHFKKQNGIQTIALMGPGGAGKTTLARQYASRQKRSSIWEINAETRENLNTSFEKLARELAKTEIDEKILRAIQEIKNPKEREEQIIQYVKDRLKKVSNWILLFDNVETFTDIQKHFPYDSETWGQGRIILTTRDSNVGNNKYVNTSISIEELGSLQKLNLFTSIMTSGHLPFTKAQEEEATNFLSEIPPFPLDVSIAAYYIKSTNIPYKSYLKQLRQNNRDFGVVQETFLKGSGDYAKTRYSIIISSLQKIINEHKDFGVMLILISMLDSQNIPRDLLLKFNKESIVDSFIYSLKKYSLITDKSFYSSAQNVSIHRNTQEIMLDYLTKILNLEKNSQLMQTISNGLENYMTNLTRKEDLFKIRVVVIHCQSILNHKNLLTNIMQGTLESELGGMYASLGNYEKAKDLLEAGLLKLEKNVNETRQSMARGLSYLGSVYGELGNYGKAKKLLKKSLLIWKNYFPQERIKTALVLVYLGNVYRDTGDYTKAKDLLKESLLLHKEHFSYDYIGMAKVYKYLGNIYRLLGDNEKSIRFLNQSLLFYKQYISEDHIELASILAHLGHAYGKSGNYEKAKNLLEESVSIYKKYFPENHIMIAWPLSVLGDIYRNLKNYENAKTFFTQSLMIYRKYLPENSFAIGWIFVSLGDVYVDLGDYEKAKNLMEKSLIIYKSLSDNHLKMAWVLAHLGNVYGKLADYEKARDLLNQSLLIYSDHLSANHPEVVWALKRLKEVGVCQSMERKVTLKGSMNIPAKMRHKAITIVP